MRRHPGVADARRVNVLPEPNRLSARHRPAANEIEIDVSLSTVSHYLKELRSAGLIRCEKGGQTVSCTPEPS